MKSIACPTRAIFATLAMTVVLLCGCTPAGLDDGSDLFDQNLLQPKPGSGVEPNPEPGPSPAGGAVSQGPEAPAEAPVVPPPPMAPPPPAAPPGVWGGTEGGKGDGGKIALPGGTYRMIPDGELERRRFCSKGSLMVEGACRHEDMIVEFDKVLEEKINDTLTGGDRRFYLKKISLKKLLELRELTAEGNGEERIKFLEGLQYCVNLERLNLRDNKIEDLTPLAGLTSLKELYLDHNNLSFVDPLANLKSLQVLSLSNNHILDLVPLRRLSHLETLDLSSNFAMVSTPEQIGIVVPDGWGGGTRLPGRAPGRYEVYLYDINPLSSLISLKNLFLSNNQIVSIESLEDLISLHFIELSGNEITDIRPFLINRRRGGLEAGSAVYLIGNPLIMNRTTQTVLEELDEDGIQVYFDRR